MDLTDGELSSVVGLVGVFVGAVIAWLFALSLAKWSRTMDLHREFSSERLGRARSEAQSFLRKHWDKSFKEISETDHLDLEAVPLWEVVYFYERLWALVRYRQVIGRIIPHLFGEIFLWWYIVCFRHSLVPMKWKSSEDIENLYLWLKSRTGATQWSRWVEAQERAYDSMRQKYGQA